MSEHVIVISQEYPTFVYILIPIATAYCGLFVSISNHFVLKSKVQSFLSKALISSNLIRELVIDLVSSMSFITYALSAYLLTPGNDEHLNILCLHDTLWLTLCLGVLSYQKIPDQGNVCNIMLSKNLIFLGLCYITVIYHYFSQTKFISLPLCFVGLYIINLVLNAYESRFKNFVLQLLNLTNEPEINSIPKCVNKLEDLEILARLYPVSHQEIEQNVSSLLRKSMRKVSGVSKLNNQLDTKVIVRMKLLQIALCIHISYKKLEQDEIQGVNEYYGCLNGTISKPSKNRSVFEQNLLKLRGNPPIQKNNINNDYQKQGNYTSNNLIIRKSTNEQPQNSEIHSSQNQSKVNTTIASTETSQILFYIFPVHILDSSKIVSNIFSVFINFGFGFLLNYSVNITSTLKFGGYFSILHAYLLLPYLPRIGRFQYLNAMALSSLWKFAVLGTVLAISIGSFSQDGLSIYWNFQNLLHYEYLLILIFLLIVSIAMIAVKIVVSYKVFLAIFCICLLIQCSIQYIKVVPLNF